MRRDPRRHRPRRRRLGTLEPGSDFPARWRRRSRRTEAILFGGLAVLGLIVIAGLVWSVVRGPRNDANVSRSRLTYLCEQAYARARSAADTAAVDGMRANANPGSLESEAFVKKCGLLREEARQRAERAGSTSGLTKR